MNASDPVVITPYVPAGNDQLPTRRGSRVGDGQGEIVVIRGR